MMTALVDGMKAQWFKLPLSGEGAMVAGVSDYFSALAKIGGQKADLYIEKGNQEYQGMYSQFKGNPAYQFSLDQAKLQTVLKELTTAMNQLNPGGMGAPDMEIHTFEGNLVILAKDKVAVVVDNFEISSNGMTFVGSCRQSPEGLVLQMKEKES